jgi:hypothetical protein
MTALERNRRRTERFRIIKRPRLKQAWPRFSITSRERLRNQTTAEHAYQNEPMEPPGLDEMTVTAMKAEVESLLFDANGSCTVLDMANAIAGSPQVMTVHAEAAAEDSTAGSEGPVNFIGRIFMGMRLGGASSREKNRQVKRRYDLMKALGQLESRPSSSGTRISTWEEAKEELRSVVSFPPENLLEVPHIDETADEIATDSLTQYKKRLQDINRRRVHDELESLSKWQQVAKVSTLPAIGKDGAGLDAADALMAKRLTEEYEKRDERLKSKAVQEMDERMKQKERDEEAQRRASSLMRQLSAEDKSRVFHALNDNGPPTQVIAQDGIDSIQRESIQRLSHGQWLNDEVISYFLVMLSKRDEEMCREDPSRKRCHFFKSFFITKLLNEGHTNPAIDGKYEYKNVKRWSKKVPGTCFVVFTRVLGAIREAAALTILMLYPSFAGKDIFKLDKIIFPINQGSMHWVCAVIYMQEKRIQFFDSMGDDGMTYLESLFEYVKDEHQDKKGSPLPDQDQWRLVPCTRDTPRQLNGTSFFSNGCFRLLLLFLSFLTFLVFCFVSLDQALTVESSLACLRTL